jgi:hypothetical protein
MGFGARREPTQEEKDRWRRASERRLASDEDVKDPLEKEKKDAKVITDRKPKKKGVKAGVAHNPNTQTQNLVKLIASRKYG